MCLACQVTLFSNEPCDSPLVQLVEQFPGFGSAARGDCSSRGFQAAGKISVPAWQCCRIRNYPDRFIQGQPDGPGTGMALESPSTINGCRWCRDRSQLLRHCQSVHRDASDKSSSCCIVPCGDRDEAFDLCSLCCVCVRQSAAQKPGWQPSPGHTQAPKWPGTAPDAQFGPPPNTETVPEPGEVDNVSRPTETVYSPQGKNTGAAVVVFPGGGYYVLAIDLEGTEVCDWLMSKGITCVVLKYRVPNPGMHGAAFSRCRA